MRSLSLTFAVVRWRSLSLDADARWRSLVLRCRSLTLSCASLVVASCEAVVR